MFLTGLLPIGLLQVWHSYDQGFWFARSAAFYELPVVQTAGHWRVVPDTIIIVLGGAAAFVFPRDDVSAAPRGRRAAAGRGV